MSCGVGRRHSSDPALHRPVATSPIGTLAREPPHAAGAALKNKNKTNKQTNKQKQGYTVLRSLVKPAPQHPVFKSTVGPGPEASFTNLL